MGVANWQCSGRAVEALLSTGRIMVSRMQLYVQTKLVQCSVCVNDVDACARGRLEMRRERGVNERSARVCERRERGSATT